MIHDIRVQECNFIKNTYIPTNHIRGFHLFYIFEGDGTLIIDSSSYNCHRGNLFLFPAVEIAIPQTAARSLLTIFHILFTANSPNIVMALHNLPHTLAPDARFRTILMAILHENTLRQISYQDVCSFYLEQLLFPAIITARRQKKLPSFHTVADSPNDSLHLACDYIEQHLMEPIAVETLCQITHQNAKQLNQQFKSAYQLSTKEYISSRRLLKAKELLHFSTNSITEIAEVTGFKSVHYFSSCFKKSEGLTPSEYRETLELAGSS